MIFASSEWTEQGAYPYEMTERPPRIASNSTPSMPAATDDYRCSSRSQDLPSDFTLKVDVRAAVLAAGGMERTDGYSDGGSEDGFKTATSLSSLDRYPPKSMSESPVGDDPAAAIAIAGSGGETEQPGTPPAREVAPISPSPTISHRGSLRRILDPSSFHAGRNAVPFRSRGPSQQSRAASASWPMYIVSVATEGSPETPRRSDERPRPRYQIVFDRQQYEFCTRLFALLDTESRSFIGPDCIREFVRTHCPVVRRRDDAIFALRGGEGARGDAGREGGAASSPTFDEIWDRTIHSDPRCTSTDAIHGIGIEGWMVFCRLLALAHHQESQRRFASRHLQQMMRHKHGGSSTRDAGVVVVVENPPPGPPSMISIGGLVDVERERAANQRDECIPGWPFRPLPPLELDLDHSFASAFGDGRASSGARLRPMGTVSIVPFSPSEEGDFILRFRSDGSGVVVRRSYSDFEWLDAILKLHKRPGQGHLCGCILPPFPTKRGGFHQQRSMLSKKSLLTRGAAPQGGQKDISERAMEAAKSGMGMISSMAKNVWSEYISGLTPSTSPSSPLNNVGTLSSPKRPRPARDKDVLTMVAHRIERYLNYLLENNALSTSFALNAILRASQSGLESAKQTLQAHAKQKKLQKSNSAADASRAGHHSAASIFSALVSKTPASLMHLQDDDDTPWLRSAAQVAMALQFHGILETTGHESTSARIQHASLPRFRNRPAGSWDDDESGNYKGAGRRNASQHGGLSECDVPMSETNFEVGVINVDSELVDEEDLGGYDLLPSPVSEEHRVLNAGNTVRGKAGSTRSQTNRSRFVYGTSLEQSGEIDDKKDSVLGSIRVENDIDKLRDIIRSINHTLEKLHQSSTSIRSAQDARNAIQLSLLRDVDSWGECGGEVISQRALVEGVAALESFSSAVEESNSAMSDDLLWQSSLATSAVASVTEVRKAVRASHTASRAKSAAFSAAEKARKAYESCDHTSSKEKIQHTQAEASTAQSHAIHATVVEYEANIAKKRSAVSLAQGVKSWNIHRKRELLRACVQAAKSQREACRKAADAWESLRGGLIDPSGSSYAKDGVQIWTCPSEISRARAAPTAVEILAPEVSTALDASDDGGIERSSSNLENSSGLHDWENSQQDFSECAAEAPNSGSSFVEEFSECIADPLDSSAVNEFTDICPSEESRQSHTEMERSMERSSGDVYCLAPPDLSHLVEDYFSLHQGIESEADSDCDEGRGHTPSICESVHSENESEGPPTNGGETMSMSMQSLIDGLMAWGDGDDENNSEGAATQAEDQHGN